MKTAQLIAALATAIGITSNIGCNAAEESTAKKIAMMPVKAMGCFVALTVGTPIAISRIGTQRFHEHTDDVKDMEGSTSSGAGGVIYALPMGFGEGLAQGLYYGPRNAFANFDKPFSKESMSLGAEVIPAPR